MATGRLTLDTMPADILELVVEAVSDLQAAERHKWQPSAAKEIFSSLTADAAAPNALKRVSRRFRTTINGLPTMWATLTDKMPEKQYMQSLENSKNKPLTVAVDGLCAHKDERLDAFLRAVLLHRRRWIAFYVSFPHGHVDESRIPPMPDREFPLLEVAMAIGCKSRRTHPILGLEENLFFSGWAMPRLTCVLLRNVALRGAAAASLRELHIHLHDVWLTRTSLQNALSDCRSLRSLRVSSTFLVRLLFDAHILDEPLCLVTVDSFTVSVSKMKLCHAQRMFHALQFPNLRDLAFCLSKPFEGAVHAWLEALFDPGAVGCVDGLRHLVIDVTDSGVAHWPECPSPVEFIFNQARFASLEQFSLSQDVLRLHPWTLKVDGSALTHVSRSLTTVDLSETRRIELGALLQLVEHLALADSQATLRVRTQSLHPRGTRPLVDAVCATWGPLEDMNFDIEWVEG